MKPNKSLFDQLIALKTEERNRNSKAIDSLPLEEILRIINKEDRRVPTAIAREIPHIRKAVHLVVNAFKRDGRLIYVGAGTSGRLGILDAAECPPTYGTDPEMVQGLIAGGKKAVFRSQEGAEDRGSDGRRDIRKMNVSNKDVVCGIAASIRTPYVVAAIKEAKRRGARTIFVTTNPRSILRSPAFVTLRRAIDIAICPMVGPEVIMGSTRMKAGTAQKLVLNMITTAAMIRLGKVYQNMMVDLRMNSRKLEERAKRVLIIATGIDYPEATQALQRANGHVKTAIVMVATGKSADEAKKLLKKSMGFVSMAISGNRNK